MGGRWSWTGVIVTVLVWLKYIGLQLGWGFQLQNPIFVYLMMLIMLGVGLNLNDRLPLPQWLESLPGMMSQVHNKADTSSVKIVLFSDFKDAVSIFFISKYFA